jgi:hypothetical protein
MSRANTILAIGVALTVWGGSSITSALGFSGWRRMDVTLFALGIMILAQARYDAIDARMRRLEDASMSKESGSSPSLG